VTGAEHVDPDALTVTIAVSDTHKIVPEVVRLLDDAGIEVVDVVIRRPTLDDVFLQLTGRTTEADDEEEGSDR
jgi:ABC-2 type transport system ATP-binding protein